MSKKSITVLLIFALLGNVVFAGEGMWLPMLISKFNFEEMQKKGLKLSAQDIYDVNQSCIKDAIVGLGQPEWNAQFNFCSGEIISGRGLFLTNHHCGYGTIQEISTTEQNYLEDGYWAMNQKEEKPAGFSVSILQRMDDVTDAILMGIDYSTSESDRNKITSKRIDSLKKAAEKDSLITAVIKPFFKGNQYYIFLYKVYQDVRFVGAPPSSIGKYGGDTDNWMWPRHTGDFSLFRIYADENNNPAPYSEKNVPYKPKHFLPISIKGIEKGDYAMIFGFPGSTDRFLTSYGVKLAMDVDQPARVKIRRKKLDLYEEGMAKSGETKLKYAAKYSQVSNYWKYFIGQSAGLKRLHVYDKKQKEEEAFNEWVMKDEGRKKTYGNVVADIEKSYTEISKYQLALTYITEAIYGAEVLRLARSFNGLDLAMSVEKTDDTMLSSATEGLKKSVQEHFKDYDEGIDIKVLAAMLKLYMEDLTLDQKSPYAVDLINKSKGDYDKVAEKIFRKSMFVSEDKLTAFLAKPSLKVLHSDPAYELVQEIRNKYNNEIAPMLRPVYETMNIAGRLYIDGLMKLKREKHFYPDANSTMRISYGQVEDYYPRDAVYYNYFTTLSGVMEKEDPDNPEFIVTGRLKDLYNARDFGRYGKDGKLVVNFISSNDITGGNSGSPVINGNGELIGTAFDGNWEAMSGDIAFEPELQRTISVDIRYTLFLIDKYANAGYLIEEMKIME